MQLFRIVSRAKAAEGEPLLSRALALQEKTVGANHIELAEPLSRLAWLKLTRDRVNEAVRLSRVPRRY